MIQDVLLYVCGIFAIALAFAAFIVVNDTFNTSVQALDDAPQNYKDLLASQNSGWTTALDYALLSIYVAFIIVMIAMSWYLDTNPLFFVVFIVLIAVVGVVAGYLSNVFYDVSSDGLLSSTFAQMPITTYILSNYVVFVIAPVLLIMVVYFGKPQGATI